MMMKCDSCGEIFDEYEGDSKTICLEDEYGVGSMFPNRNYKDILICPCCGSEELEEYYEDDEDEA